MLEAQKGLGQKTDQGVAQVVRSQVVRWCRVALAALAAEVSPPCLAQGVVLELGCCFQQVLMAAPVLFPLSLSQLCRADCNCAVWRLEKRLDQAR